MNTSNQNILNVENLSKTFSQGNESVKVLQNLSLNVKKGEFVAVMGASGSGKSTLLHLLAGLLQADSGSDILVAGENYAGLKEKELTKFRLNNIGLIFQNYNLVRALNIKENIRLPLLLTDSKDSKYAEIGSLINQLGLSDRISHLPRQLSGGEQQRVAIARALITEPQLILADEPTGNLDLKSGTQICELLASIAEKHQQTIILVTHAPHVAFYADRIIMLSEGKISSDFARDKFASAGELSVHYQELLLNNSKK